MELRDTALFKFLKKNFPKDQTPNLVDQALALEQDARDLLSGVALTFAHYPSHGFDHSQEIIENISNILFKKDKPKAKELNYMEAFLIIAAAYTHDVGMRISDDEKKAFLASPEWKKWSETDANAKAQLVKINSKDKSDALQVYGAGRALDFLIADFLRYRHALRSGYKIRLQPELFRKCTVLQNESFRDAIAVIAEGHGVGYAQLESNHIYNENKMISGQAVNLRFLAILLRFGDLCDLRFERTHTIFKAMTDIPKNSVPHWEQYKDIRDKTFNYQELRFTAYCDTAESYRELRHWCTWMEEEFQKATIVMRFAKRHNDWCPPQVRLADAEVTPETDTKSTIFVLPAAGVSFIPRDWKFRLNEHLVMRRLVYDVYENKIDFLRELIQNALDASRAKMIKRLEEDGERIPSWLPDIAKTVRDKYPVQITVEDRLIDDVEHQVICVEDHGLGMDEEVIQKYFLQIGQSYYTTDDFEKDLGVSRKGKFTSQFGVGFLSVFAVSDHVQVETYKGVGKGNPLRLTLSGPEDFLLPETMKSMRTCGTRIEVVMRKPFEAVKIEEAVRGWCQHVELPIFYNGDKVTRFEDRDLSVLHTLVSNEGAPIKTQQISYQQDGVAVEGFIFFDTGQNTFLQADDIVDFARQWGNDPHYSLFFHGIRKGEIDFQEMRNLIGYFHIDDRRQEATISMEREGSISALDIIQQLNISDFMGAEILKFYHLFENDLDQDDRLMISSNLDVWGVDTEGLKVFKLCSRTGHNWVSLKELKERKQITIFPAEWVFRRKPADFIKEEDWLELPGYEDTAHKLIKDFTYKNQYGPDFEAVTNWIPRQNKAYQVADRIVFEEFLDLSVLNIKRNPIVLCMVNLAHPVGKWLYLLLTEASVPSEFQSVQPNQYWSIGLKEVQSWNNLPGLPEELKAPTDIPPEFEQYPDKD